MMLTSIREKLVDGLLDHMLYLHVAHHVEGRIRIKASWNGAKKLNQSQEGAIERIISAIPGITEYRVNKKALSVVIKYDPTVLPFTLWEEVAALSQHPALRESVRTRLLEALNRGTISAQAPQRSPHLQHETGRPARVEHALHQEDERTGSIQPQPHSLAESQG